MRSRSIGLTPPRGMSAKEYFVRGITPSQPETVDDPLLDGGLIVNLHEWRFNLTTGESTERMLSDWRVSGDFPRLNEGYQGRKHKYGYVAVHDLEASRAAGEAPGFLAAASGEQGF
jgi:carotenoid cleavage dioxygenase-like enzyme